MAKEVAQTVGGKRIAWLIAILAAFAVLASIGNRLSPEPAEAVVLPGTILQCTTTFAGATVVACPQQVTGGDLVNFRGTASNIAPGGTLNITVNLDANYTVVQSACSNGSTPLVAGNAVTCAFAQGTVNGRTFVQGRVNPQPNGAGNILPLISNVTASDSDLVVGFDIEIQTFFGLATPNLSAVKTDNPDPVDAGSNGSYTILVSNLDGAPVPFGQTAEDVVIVDVVPMPFIPISATIDVGPAGGAVACAIVGQTVTCPAVDLVSSLLGVGFGPEDALVLINYQVPINIAAGTIVGPNTATVTARNISNTVTSNAVFTTVNSVASASLTKQADPSQVAVPPPGNGQFSWVFQVVNTGTAPLTGFTLNDANLSGGPPNVFRINGSAAIAVVGAIGVQCTSTVGPPSTLNCTTPNPLPAGGSVTITVPMVLIGTPAAGNYVNSATVDFTQTNPITAEGTVSIVNQPSLSIAKAATATANPGGAITYTITVTNNGAGAATNVVVADVIPAGITVGALPAGCVASAPPAGEISCTAANIAAGGTAVFTIPATVGATAVAGNQFMNTACIVAPAPAPGASNCSTALTTVTGPALTITKSSSGTVTHAPSSGSFTIVVGNTGTSTATNVTVVDQLSAALTTPGATVAFAGGAAGLTCAGTGAGALVNCTGGTLPVGGTITVTIPVGLTGTVFNGTTITNSATADADLTGPVSDDAQISAQAPVLALTKTSAGNVTTTAGSGSFTLVVTNTGTANAPTVTVVDVIDPRLVAGTLPAGCASTAPPAGEVTCTATNLAAGASATFVIPVSLVPPGVPAGTIIPNTATASTANAAPVSASDDIVVAGPALTVTKSASQDPVSTQPAVQFTWNITVTNIGSQPATAVTVTDTIAANLTIGTLPAGCTAVAQAVTCTFATIAAGASVNIAIPVTPNAAAANGTTISNTATANCTNCAAPASGSASVTVLNNPVLSFSKTDTPDPVAAGSNITYVLTVTNTGNTPAPFNITDSMPTNITFVSAIGAGGVGPITCTPAAPPPTNPPTVTCTGTVPAGSVAAPAATTVTIIVTVPVGTASGSVVSNSALLTSSAVPGFSATATAVTNVIASALSLTKTNSPLIIGQNGVVISTLIVTNNGTLAATGVTVVDRLMAGATFVPTGSTQGCTVTIPATTLTAAAAVGATSLTVASSAGFVAGDQIIIGGAVYTVTAVPNATTLTIAAPGLAAAAAVGATVTGPNVVTCPAPGTPDIAPGQSRTITVAFNVGTITGVVCNIANTTNTAGMQNGTASACVTVVATAAGAGLVHVDVDPAHESASHASTTPGAGLDPNQVLHNPGSSELQPIRQVDADDAIGSQHTVCLVHPTLGLNDQANIVWTFSPGPGQTVTVSPAPAGEKLILAISDLLVNDPEANCVRWRSAGEGDQSVTATHTVTGQVFYAFGAITTISAAEAVGQTELSVVSSAGFAVGQTVTIGGATFTITAVSAAAGANTITVSPALTVAAATGTLVSTSTVLPIVKEWNSLDFTKIVAVTGNLGTTIFTNTQDFASWTSLAAGGTCVRDNDIPLSISTAPRCFDRPNVDAAVSTHTVVVGETLASIAVTYGTTVAALQALNGGITTVTPGQVITIRSGLGEITSVGTPLAAGSGSGLLIATTAHSFIDYVVGAHLGVVDPTANAYFGPIDGALQTYTLNPTTGVLAGVGTCGSARVENPVTGAVHNLTAGASSVSVLSSDKGVGIQVAATFNGDTVGNVANADCFPGEATVIRIQTREEVQLRSDLDTTPDEYIIIRWVAAPPPAKQVFLAWAGQRVILEHDWRIPAGDVPDTADAGDVVNPVATACPFTGPFFRAHAIRQAQSPGNFLPTFAVNIIGNDDATVLVNTGVNQQTDYDNPGDANTACISRFLYESEDPGQVDVEIFVDRVGCDLVLGCGNLGVSSTKVAIVVYYMKFEEVVLSIVDDVRKPTHNGPDNALNTQYSIFPNPGAGVAGVVAPPGTNGDYAPGNPWNAANDVTTYSTNVSRDVLIRGRVKGWFINANPSGRARDASNPLNVLPQDRWVLPDDWDLLAGGPDGDEVFGTAENFSPQYDIMIAPNTPKFLACATPIGGCGETQNAVTLLPNYTDVLAPVEGPFSLLDIPNSTLPQGTKGLQGAAVWSGLRLVRNTIIRDFDVDSWDAPMPPALVTVDIRGSGFIKQVRKQDVYWTTPGAGVGNAAGANSGTFLTQDYPNPFYWTNIPDSAFIPAVAVGGGWHWNTWGAGSVAGVNTTTHATLTNPAGATIVNLVANGATGLTPGMQVIIGGVIYTITSVPNTSTITITPALAATITAGSLVSSVPAVVNQGPYNFWWPLPQFLGNGLGHPNRNPSGVQDLTVTAAENAELQDIRNVYAAASTNPSEGRSIGRTLNVYSDNHGEFMVTANGDFKLTYTGCAANVLGGVGARHCDQGDAVGTSNLYATVDYPDFRGKHFPVRTEADITINWTWGGYKEVTVEPGETDFFRYVVFHALDRDGFCAIPAGAVSLHPVLSSADALNRVGANDPIENVDFLIDAGEGIIDRTSTSQTATFGVPGPWNGLGTSPNFVAPNQARLTPGVNDGRQFATQVPTFNTGASTTDVDFRRLHGSTEECQAWVRVSNTLLGILDILIIAHDDEGDIGFDRIVDFQDEASYQLTFQWSLITWVGEDGISPAEALEGNNPPTTDITDEVTAIYGWDQAAQEWLGWFPNGVGVPGANDLTALRFGQAYWIAIEGPGNVTWTIATDVG